MKSSLQITGSLFTSGNSNRLLLTWGKLVLFFGVFIYSHLSIAATISSTSTGGDWDNSGTWVGGIVPTSADDVIIVAGATVVVHNLYVDSSPAVCNSVTIDGTLTIGSGSTTVHRLDVLTFLQIDIGGTLNQGGNALQKIVLSGNFINNGTFAPLGNGGAINFTFSGTGNQLISSSASSITFADIILSMTVGKNLSFGGSITSVTTQAITQNTGDFFSPPTLTANGEVRFYGNTTTAINTFKAGASIFLTGNFTNAGGNFDPGTGTVTFSGSSAQTIGEAGGVYNTTFYNLSTSNTTYTTGDMPVFITGDLVVGDGSTFSTTNDFAVGGKTTVGTGTSGTLVIGSTVGSKLFTGLVTINSGATWTNTVDENIRFASGVTNLGTFISGNGIYFFINNPQQTNGNISVATADISIALTNQGTFTITTNLQGTGGSITQGANAVLNIGGVNTLPTLTASASGNTVNYTGGAQSVVGINYVNLGLSGSGAKTLSTNTTSISGNLSISGTASTTTVISLTIGGNLLIGDGSSFSIANTNIMVAGTTTVGNGTSGSLIFLTTASNKDFTGLVTISSGAKWDNSIGSNVNLYNGLINNGNFLGGVGTYFFKSNNQSVAGSFTLDKIDVASGITLTNNATLTVTTDLSSNGGWVQGLNSIVNIGGTSNFTSLDATSFANTVNYSGASQNVKGFNYYNLGLTGTGSVTLYSGISSVAGNFTLSGTVSTSTSNAMAIGGDFFVGDGSTFGIYGFDFSVGGKTVIGSGLSGTLNFLSVLGAKTFTGLVTVNAGATWNNSTVNAAIGFKGGITNSGVFQSGTGTHTFDTNNQILNGSFSIPNVIINTITLTNNTSLTVATSLSGTGSIKQGSAASLTINGSSTLASIDGTASGNSVTYNAASPAVIKGSYSTLTLNQSSGTAVLTGNTSIGNVLALSTGNLDIATSNLTIGTNASISIVSPSAASMIVASGGGEVRKNFSAIGSFTFPIGDNTGTIEYSPVTVNLTTATGFASGYIGASVVNAKHPSNASPTDFLTRYWNISQSGISGCVATVSATYLPADITGTEVNIQSAQLNGTFNQAANGWKKFSTLGSNLLTATGSTLTSGSISAYTGISGLSPTVSVTGGGVTVCAGTAVSLGSTSSGIATLIYSWSPAAGLSATNIANPVATPASTTTYTLTVYDGNGIPASSNLTITTQQPTVVVNDLTLCVGSSGTLTASGAVMYSWTAASGLSATTGSTVTANPSVTTNYIVTGTDANSCTNTATAHVTVLPLPTVSVNSPSTCLGTSTTLTASGAVSYSWSSGLSSNTGSSVTANPTTTSDYVVTGTDANSCSNTATAHVVVLALPIVTVNSPSTCLGTAVTLTASGAVSYSWSSGLSATTGASVTGNPTSTTSYTVTGTNANNCSATATATITVNAIPAKPTITATLLNTISPLLTSSSTSGNQWFKDASSIAGATNQTYQAKANGSYSVQVTINGCVSPMSDNVSLTITAIESPVYLGDLHLFPVPSDKQLNIDWGSFAPESTIEIKIYDILGRAVLIQSMSTNETSIDISHLTSGQFIFQALQGNQLSTQRFTKK